MTVDAHQHFWKYNPTRDAWITSDMEVLRADFLPEHLHPILQQHRIEACVAVQADQSETETEFLLQLAQQHTFIKGVVGWVDLCAANIEERLMHFSKDKKLKGFRHILQAEPDPEFMLRKEFMNGIRQLESFNFTYDLLIYSHHLPVACKLVGQFPNQAFVVDHLAKPPIKSKEIETWKTGIQLLSHNENVWCKLSGMVTEADWKYWTSDDLKQYMDVVMDSFGPHRILYGSDWPVCLLAANYAQQYKVVKDYISKLSTQEQESIMGRNATTFYNL